MFQKMTLIVLAGLFLPGICQANPIIIQKMTKGPKGYVIMVETSTGKHCWGMPQPLDSGKFKFPDTPMGIEAAAAKFHWPTPTGEQLKACKKMMHIPLKVYSNQDKIQKMTKGPKGYVIMLETATGKHCWGMPQRLDLDKLPDTPMDIEAAAAKFHWPTPTGEQLKACKKMMHISHISHISWKVYSNQDQATQPVYQVADNKDKVHNKVTDKVIDQVKTNSDCGDYINTYGISDDLTYRLVTGKAGKQGAALCKKHK